MRVAYNGSDDRAGLRGYVQFNKCTYIHTYTHSSPVLPEVLLLKYTTYIHAYIHTYIHT